MRTAHVTCDACGTTTKRRIADHAADPKFCNRDCKRRWQNRRRKARQAATTTTVQEDTP